jgi:hypothetical protein
MLSFSREQKVIKMEHKFDGVIMLFLTIAIGVILVGTVVLPQTFTPQARYAATVENTTALSPVNSTGYQNATFTTTYVYATDGCNLTIAFLTNLTANSTRLTSVAGVAMNNFTSYDNATAITAISSTYINTSTDSSGQVVQKWRYNTSSTATHINITDANLTCIKKSTFEQTGADAGSLAMWGIVPLVIIALLMLMIIGGRR